MPVLLLTVVTGCHQEFPQPSSTLLMGDEKIAGQLLRGFYGIEDEQWRWVGRVSSVTLKPPPQSEQRGATLQVRIFLPGPLMEELGSLTLSAQADSVELEPETFEKAGSYTYARYVPPGVMATNLLPVTFSFDKAVPARAKDSRERAAIVTAIELRSQ